METENKALEHVVCQNCKAENDFYMRITPMLIHINDKDTILIDANIPVCNKCGNKIEVTSIMNRIQEEAKEKYERAKKLFK